MDYRYRTRKGSIVAIRKYYKHHQLKFILAVLVIQICIATMLWFVTLSFSETVSSSELALIIVGVFLISELLVGLALMTTIFRPLKQMVDAIVYAYRDKPLDAHSTPIELIRRLHAEKTSEADAVVTEQQFASALLDHLPVGIVVLDAKRSIVYTNAAAPTKAGGKELNINFSDSDSLSVWLDQIVDKNIAASRWWKRMRQVNATEENRQFFDVLALYNQDGVNSLETVLVCVDRTEEYAADEDDLDFTALAAHELRGPITVIKGYLDVLRQELDLTDDQKAFFERLDVSADRLTTYINNILNVSRYDRRHLQLRLKEEPLSKIYSSVGDDLDLRARTHHRILHVTIPEDLPAIAADRGSLSEVIVNLVDNAIKYSNEGGLVVVSAQVVDTFVEVSVQDNGIGIPGSLLSHIFDKFYRSHRSRENTVGTGLGLYITKAIIESHGGTISVRSEEGHGTTFTFRIPTYASVADKLAKSDNTNESIIQKKEKKFIKNHSMYRG